MASGKEIRLSSKITFKKFSIYLKGMISSLKKKKVNSKDDVVYMIPFIQYF